MSRAVLARLRIGPQRRTVSSVAGRTAVCVLLLALMFGTLAAGTLRSSDALDTIGHGAGRQVIATADLYYALSDADIQVATLLLYKDVGEHRRNTAHTRFEQRRAEVTEALLQAHDLAGDDEAQRETVATIMELYGHYEELASRAVFLAERSDYPSGELPGPVLELYREAEDVMSGQLLPYAYNLALENGTVVRRTYDDVDSSLVLSRITVALTSIAALAGLVWLQLHAARRFRRVLNLGLILATGLTLLYGVTGQIVLSSEREALTEAKVEAFDPAFALARARAVSNSAYGDQIKYFVDPARAQIHAQTYYDKSQTLAYLDSDNLSAYQERVKGTDIAGLDGLLGDALVGDGPSREMAAIFRTLQNADRAMRDSGDIDELKNVQAAYASYEGRLDELMRTHTQRFDDAVADGERAVADFGFLLPAAFLSVIAFIVAGLVPRLREFA
ncbi:hypothetical protein [Salininema proteolyticum]|uniref:Chemotaxis methyl-accepting receptor HlyB-like 4HB MCP domain-containing protein n=1 Tax=Salininema proteolyticum TaxID=1607685 RepID=A0ABV8U050_9ACTN